jgi:hypothetical protein
MQESIRQLLTSDRGISGLEASEQDHHVSEPLLPLLKQALADASVPIPTHLVFGMEMLLLSYKAFLWPGDEIEKRNRRITALRFSQEVTEAISSVVTAILAIETCMYISNQCPFLSAAGR